MDLSKFTEANSRLCCEAIIELLGSIEDILEDTQFNKQGIDMDTLEKFKAALKKHMERKCEYIMNHCDLFSQGNVSAEHKFAFLNFCKHIVLPFVEKHYGDGKYKIYIKSGNMMVPVEPLDFLNKLAEKISSIFDEIFRDEGTESEKVALVKEIKLYLYGFCQCINGIYNYHEEFGQTGNHESPDIDDNARKLIKEDIFDFINGDLIQMSQSIKALFLLVQQGDKELLFTQFKDHFESSFKVRFGDGEAESFDDVIKFNPGSSSGNGGYGVEVIDYVYSTLASSLNRMFISSQGGSN
ncbi:hypothetical protein H4219_005105 [Mycoemilia scoparia]|uniref:Uncharacterized protein n=1 Tax=Mycoemilia scoparia TaxID=417184 RepID=A0A9W7ZQA3_9FUNG|nr:hypothetical protein H4219_005105 [Mycoemilia scoparia]